MFSTPLSKCQEQLLVCMAKMCLFCKKLLNCLQKNSAFLLAVKKSSCCSMLFGGGNVLDFGPSSKGMVVSHCVNLVFPNDLLCRTSSHNA
jgi:hypothetical protein